MIGLIKNLKNIHNLQLQYLNCNNAGENVAFKKACKQQGLGVDFKCTALGMLQQKGHIKRKFAILFNQFHAMLNGGKFNAYLWNGLWAKASNTAMLLENNLLTPTRNLSSFQQFFGEEKRIILSLMQKFCEMCITTYSDNTHWAKLDNQGTPDIWVGYAEVHHTGIYWVFNPKTKRLFWPGTWLFYKSLMVSIPRLKNLSWSLWTMRGLIMRRDSKWFQ